MDIFPLNAYVLNIRRQLRSSTRTVTRNNFLFPELDLISANILYLLLLQAFGMNSQSHTPLKSSESLYVNSIHKSRHLFKLNFNPKSSSAPLSDDIHYTLFFYTGISTLKDTPANASVYLAPLLRYAAEHIPRSKHKETPLYVMATAGLRMLSKG